jgi:hypothetical protein
VKFLKIDDYFKHVTTPFLKKYHLGMTITVKAKTSIHSPVPFLISINFFIDNFLPPEMGYGLNMSNIDHSFVVEIILNLLQP